MGREKIGEGICELQASFTAKGEEPIIWRLRFDPLAAVGSRSWAGPLERLTVRERGRWVVREWFNESQSGVSRGLSEKDGKKIRFAASFDCKDAEDALSRSGKEYAQALQAFGSSEEFRDGGWMEARNAASWGLRGRKLILSLEWSGPPPKDRGVAGIWDGKELEDFGWGDGVVAAVDRLGRFLETRWGSDWKSKGNPFVSLSHFASPMSKDMIMLRFKVGGKPGPDAIERAESWLEREMGAPLARAEIPLEAESFGSELSELLSRRLESIRIGEGLEAPAKGKRLGL